MLGQDESQTIPFVRRAIALEPSDPRHHLTAARILYRLRQFDGARKDAEAALKLAAGDAAASGDAQRLLEQIEAAKR